MFESVVKNGATFLDATVPGWYKKIDLEILEISSTCCCIIGQLFDDYCKGTQALSIVHDTIELGFSLQSNAGLIPCLWEKLTEAWKQEIRQRLELELAISCSAE